MDSRTKSFTNKDVEKLLPGIRVVGSPMIGGQKAVFPIELNGTKLAFKIIPLKPSFEDMRMQQEEPVTAPSFEEARERVMREISILEKARIPQLARIGPIPLTDGNLGEYRVQYYTEEWIDGLDLCAILRRQGVLSPIELIRLGLDANCAIEWLWQHSKVHRDIKPGNVMRRENGTFVLVDLGTALDLQDKSLTMPGFTVGTPQYLSPEHLELVKKRDMDFRSDMYCLGVT